MAFNTYFLHRPIDAFCSEERIDFQWVFRGVEGVPLEVGSVNASMNIRLFVYLLAFLRYLAEYCFSV